MAFSLSLIIPAYNAAEHLKACLESLAACSEQPTQLIVVDDGSTDGTSEVAHLFGAEVYSTEGRRGPAFARNLGAKQASGEILLFIDSDVCVRPDTILKIRESFERDAALDALIGSYDRVPRYPEFLSQYRNLMHSYFHQTGAERASTFWSGCGAIRRAVFMDHSGFDDGRFGRPAVEDIELGYRLTRAGHKITLDPGIQVTHLKRWTFWGLTKTDILDRGIPWTELILRERFMPDDLNLRLSQRVSVALVFLLLCFSCVEALFFGGYFLIPLFAILFALMARWWVEFALPRRPVQGSILMVSTVILICLDAFAHHMIGLIPPLLMTPVLLIVGHRYGYTGKRRKLLQWFAIAYTCSAIGLAARYLPAHNLMLVGFALLALLGLINSQFYIFLAANRGIPFMLAAIPFHILYHFYSGLSFTAGVVSYAWTHRSNVPRNSPPRRQPETEPLEEA